MAVMVGAGERQELGAWQGSFVRRGVWSETQKEGSDLGVDNQAKDARMKGNKSGRSCDAEVICSP